MINFQKCFTDLGAKRNLINIHKYADQLIQIFKLNTKGQ